MGDDFYFLPKGKFIVKLPRRSPHVVRMVVLAIVMMCSIYVSLVSLKQTKALAKSELVRIRPSEDSSDSKIVVTKHGMIPIKPELMSVIPIEHSDDLGIVVSKQREPLDKPELLRTLPLEQSFDSGMVSLEHSVTNEKIDGGMTKPFEKHSYDRRIFGLKLTDQVVKSGEVSTHPAVQPHDPRAISFMETKFQTKPEPLTLKETVQPASDRRIVGLGQVEIQDKPDQDRTRQTNQHPSGSSAVSLNRTNFTTESSNATSSCEAPQIPESEIPYIHYPTPIKYSRRECVCTPVRFYVIISMQRSGSKWLESLLNSHVNISSNGEIFIDRQRSANVSALTSTLDTVYNLDWRHSTNKKACMAAVGFKWMLNQGILENHEEICKYFSRRGVSVIFLFRRNLLRRMISLLANSHKFKEMNDTHKAHVITQQEANVLASYRPKLNAKLLVSKLKRDARRAADAKEYFKNVRHMDLYYEDLVQNNTQKLTEVMEFLRVPQRRLSSHHVKIHTRPISQMIQNWSAVRRALRRSQFESFLSSN